VRSRHLDGGGLERRRRGRIERRELVRVIVGRVVDGRHILELDVRLVDLVGRWR
jgi:hypothetical protein